MVLREHNLPDKSYSRAMLSLQKLVFDWLFHCVSIAAYLQAFLNFMMRLNIRLARRWKKSMIKDNMKHYKLWSGFCKKVPIFFSFFVINMNFLYNLFSILANSQYYSYGSCSICSRKTTDWFLYCCKRTKLPVIYTNIIFLYSFTVNLLHSRMELKFVESRALNI